MAIIGMEGFDYFDTATTDIQINDVDGYTIDNPLTSDHRILTDIPRFGTGKYLKIFSNNQFRVSVAGTGITNKMYVGFAIRFEGTMDHTRFMHFYDDTDIAPHVWLKITNTGVLRARNGNGELIADSAYNFSLNTWYWVEVEVTIATAGTTNLIVEVNGVPWISTTGSTKAGALTNIGHFSLGGGITDLCFDDLVWQDGTGAFLDDCRIETLLPTGDNSIQWSQTGAGSNANDVNDIGADATIDADYVYTNVSTNKDFYEFDTISTDSVVHALAINYRASKDDTGSRSVRSVHSGGSSPGTTNVLTDGWLIYSDIYEHLTGTTDWTQGNIGTSTFGIEDIT